MCVCVSTNNHHKTNITKKPGSGIFIFRHHITNVNPFLQMGHDWVVGTLFTGVDGGWCLRDSGAYGSKLASNPWSTSLIVDIYPEVSTPRHVLISSPHKNNIYIPVPASNRGPKISEAAPTTHCCDQRAKYSTMTHLAKYGLALGVWYHTPVTTGSRFWAGTPSSDTHTAYWTYEYCTGKFAATLL